MNGHDTNVKVPSFGNWESIETAPENTPVLLRYKKNLKGDRSRVSGVYVVTEATYVPPHFWEWDTEQKRPQPGAWRDHLDRLICEDQTAGKPGKNSPENWMPLPDPPEPR